MKNRSKNHVSSRPRTIVQPLIDPIRIVATITVTIGTRARTTATATWSCGSTTDAGNACAAPGGLPRDGATPARVGPVERVAAGNYYRYPWRLRGGARRGAGAGNIRAGSNGLHTSALSSDGRLLPLTLPLPFPLLFKLNAGSAARRGGTELYPHGLPTTSIKLRTIHCDGFLGSSHATSQFYWLCGHGFLRPRLAPTVQHCSATLVQRPLARASPSAPHVCPLGCALSPGHTPLSPCMSRRCRMH
jgi:hypothetical protein